MKLPLKTLTLFSAVQLLLTEVVPGQILTHGPVVGGVTAAEAKVFVRTDQAANVALEYGTRPSAPRRGRFGLHGDRRGE